MIAAIVVIVLVVLVAGFVWLTYNSLVALRASVDAAWSQISVQLQRRLDLIPNLVETVKGYAAHEAGVLEAVTAARGAAANAVGPAAQAQAQGALTGALGRLFAVAEAYPDLKANQSFQQLQSELSDTEGRIAYARASYNESVQRLNTKIAQFPAVLVAKLGSFPAREYYQADEAAATAPQVSFAPPANG